MRRATRGNTVRIDRVTPLEHDDLPTQVDVGIAVVRIARLAEAVSTVDELAFEAAIGRESERCPVAADRVLSPTDDECICVPKLRPLSQSERLEETVVSAGGLEAHLSELCGDVIGGAAGAPGSDLAALEAVVRKIPDVRHRPVVHIRGVAGVGARFLGEGGCGESQ